VFPNLAEIEDDSVASVATKTIIVDGGEAVTAENEWPLPLHYSVPCSQTCPFLMVSTGMN